mgnify:CR=1 FL=1
MQATIHAMSVRKFLTPSDMPPVGPKLKELRLRAKPSLSLRKMADALEMPHASYQFYEREDGYKKALLPLDFARRVAAVLGRHRVDPTDVMKLAGLSDGEAEPEARGIEAARPSFQFATLSVALPSEDALADMFQTMLVAVPADASRAEAARILAQLLPSGFASIGPAALVPGNIGQTGAGAAPQSPAKDSPGSEQPQHN